MSRRSVFRGCPVNVEPGPVVRSSAVRNGSLAAWRVAVRPRTLLVAFSPVLVGATLGFARTGAIDPLAALLVLGAALLMQIVTNMQNDVGYTVRGGDRSGTRTGLPRATANGWLSVRHVRAGIVVAALVATALGLALVAHRGWPVLVIGCASLLAALAYMGGPKPIAYTPLGELTVFVFFGLVAVMGTDWVLTAEVGTVSMVASVAIGALAAAALAVNNHRDIAHDRLVGRRTFAVSFGERASRRQFAGLLLGPFALVPLMAWLAAAPSLLMPLLLLPAAVQLRGDFDRCPPGVAFNAILFRTFRLELWFAALLSAGALLARSGLGVPT
jgi:1,4-dihydroxy-2-naphthoate polyprenyltransferase